MQFIHLSDLHFHRSQADNKDANSVLTAVGARYPNHCLIVTGDITDDGHRVQYQNAHEALKPFIGRVFITPGNHDFGAAGNFYSVEKARLFDEMLSIPLGQSGTFTGDNTPVVSTVSDADDAVLLITVDTNLETDHFFDFACGEVGQAQLSYLERILSDPHNAGMTRILFFHHHPFMHGNPFMELKDAPELMRTIYRRVDVVLFGHKHVAGMWENLNGIQYILAADNAPGKDWARQITVERGKITVKDVSIKPVVKARRGRKKA